MRLPWTARTRRLVLVVMLLVALSIPLFATMLTRARVVRSGVDVTATVLHTSRSGERYLVAFRLPEEVDPDQLSYSAEVDKASYDKAAASQQISVRVLEGRPAAHRIEGEIESSAPYVAVAVAEAIVLVVGLGWFKLGRRRPPVRMRATEPLEPADTDEGSLARQADDAYEAIGTVVSADDAEVVIDVAGRQVVVVLDGHPNPVAVGSPVRARGPIIG